MAVDYPSLVSVVQTDTFEEWRVKTNSMIAHTEAAAQNIGNNQFLTTDAGKLGTSSIVDAINEVDFHTDTNTTSIGSIPLLDTKIGATDLVTALNNAVTYHENYTTTAVADEAALRLTKDNDLQNELDVTQAQVGLSTTGQYQTPTGTTYLGSTATVVSALAQLDTNLNRVDTFSNALTTTVTGGTENTFDYDGEVINYLPTEDSGNAVVKKGLIALDKQIKVVVDLIDGTAGGLDGANAKIDALITSVGAGANGTTTVDAQNDYANSAEVVANIRALDNQVKINTDNIATINSGDLVDLTTLITTLRNDMELGDNTLDGRLDKLTASVGASNDGTITPTASNVYATSEVIKTGIAQIDAILVDHASRLGTQEGDDSASTAVNALRNDVEAIVGVDTLVPPLFPLLNTALGQPSDLVSALNNLYSLIQPIIDEYNASGGFVKKNGDVMTGGLTIQNADLFLSSPQGSQHTIRVSGDISAYDNAGSATA